MTISGTTTGTDVAAFVSESEARAAMEKLLQAGFASENLRIEKRSLDLKMRHHESATREGAKGGAIAGAVCGALAGYTVTFFVNYLPDSAGNNPEANPILGLIIGAIIGTVGLSAIGALSGSDAPRTNNNRAVTEEYSVRLDGDSEEIQRALTILGNQGI
jgi:hypothetical protein